MAAGFIAVIGLTLAIRASRWAASRWGGVTGGAQWIWVAHDRRLALPLAFDLVRDFTLAPPLPRQACLMALGDQEYILYLNGKRVGGGVWQPGARLAVYEVGPLLRLGGNRLLAEVRSADGAGGFLGDLVDETSGRALVITDADWRAIRRHRLGLMRGWLPIDPLGASPLAALAATRATTGATAAGSSARSAAVSAAGPGEAAFSWGRPPLGRWGHVTPGWRRPLFEELTGGRRPVPAASAVHYRPPAVTGVAGDDAMTLFDWGREMTGYLALETGYEPGMDPDLVPPPPDRQRTALLWTGDQPPQPAAAGGEPSGAVLVMAGDRQWLDARLRRFRYALVIGLERPLAARVYTVDEGLAARSRLDVTDGRGGRGAGGAGGTSAALGDGGRRGNPAAGGPSLRGVFGLEPPRLRTPVEDEIRRKLKRLPGVAGRKEL